MGDVTFLHDANGLVLGPDEPRPDLTIVVVNDDGGSIFAMLEQGDPAYADRYDRLFGTPHGVDIASLCAATRTPHWRVESPRRARARARQPQRRDRGRRGAGTPRQPPRPRRPDPRARPLTQVSRQAQSACLNQRTTSVVEEVAQRPSRNHPSVSETVDQGQHRAAHAGGVVQLVQMPAVEHGHRPTMGAGEATSSA